MLVQNRATTALEAFTWNNCIFLANLSIREGSTASRYTGGGHIPSNNLQVVKPCPVIGGFDAFRGETPIEVVAIQSIDTELRTVSTHNVATTVVP